MPGGSGLSISWNKMWLLLNMSHMHKVWWKILETTREWHIAGHYHILWHYHILCDIIIYCVTLSYILCDIIIYCVTLSYTVWHYLCDIIIYCVTLSYTVWHYHILCDIICVTLSYTVWHYHILCDIIIYCVTLSILCDIIQVINVILLSHSWTPMSFTKFQIKYHEFIFNILVVVCIENKHTSSQAFITLNQGHTKQTDISKVISGPL